MQLTLGEIYRLFNFNTKETKMSKKINIKGISTDTRNLKSGEVFFAIKGENTDGHKFIKEAFAKGACLVIAEKYKGNNIIRVNDTKKALLKLASFYLKKINGIKVFAITGSNGKTTVKEMLYRLMEKTIGRQFVLKSQKSYNNIIGVPLTIFRLNERHRFLILEIGMNRLGEIKEIMDSIKADVVVITNIGLAHIGFLKSQKNIARAKSEIFYGLKPYGFAVLNRDDGFYDFLSATAGKIAKNPRIVSFGEGDNADFKIMDIRYNGDKLLFSLLAGKRKIKIKTGMLGTHNAFNMAAAVAAARCAGVKMEKIEKAVKNFVLKNMMRMEKKYEGGITIINDCYNANPDSFRVALKYLKENRFKNTIAVIGDMYELGKWTKKFHCEVGELFAGVNLKKLIVVGRYSDYYIEGFLKAGGNKNQVAAFNFDQKDQVSSYLSRIIEKGDILFLKGSRKNKLEEILDNLKFIYNRR